jgi:hypothetical protein
VTPEQVVATRPAYRAPEALPPAAGPSRAPTLLFAAAALVALLGAVLAITSRRRAQADPAVDLLERALRLVRESTNRQPPDRRRALDNLAATLGDAPPADRATRLAWARPEPDPATTGSVADEVAR